MCVVWGGILTISAYAYFHRWQWFSSGAGDLVIDEPAKKFVLPKTCGRNHRVASYCALFAGAGIQGGAVVGRTDRIAAMVTADPISPQDVLATVYRCLGYGPETTIRDPRGRVLTLYDTGQPLAFSR